MKRSYIPQELFTPPVVTPGSSSLDRYDSENWRDNAGCVDVGTGLFFPEEHSTNASVQELSAKAICKACNVASACLEFAMRTGQEGIWGGYNDKERRTIKRGRRALIQSSVNEVKSA